MTPKHFVPLLALLLALVGCSTPYSNAGLIGGASETQLSTVQWQVRFRGNGYTSEDKAADYCLLRCADIALREGYPFFVVVDGATRVDHAMTMQQTTMSTNVSRTGPNSYRGNGTATSMGWTVRKPTANNTIVLLPEQTPRGDAYDAAIVARSLRKKYGIK